MEVLTLVLQALLFLAVIFVGVFLRARFRFLSDRLEYYKEQLEEERKAEAAIAERYRRIAEIEREYSQKETQLRDFQANKREAELAVKPIIDELKVSPGLASLALIKRLGDSGSHALGAVDYLLRQFRAAELASVKSLVLYSLVKIAPSQARDAIRLGLIDKNAGIKAYCAFLAGQHKMGDVTELLGGMLEEPDLPRCVKSNVLWALRELGVQRPQASAGTGQVYAYVLAKAPTTIDPEVFNRLKKIYVPKTIGVVEAGVVQGDYDLIMEVTAPDMDSFNDLIMNSIQGKPWIGLTRTFIVVSKPPYLHWIRAGSIGSMVSTSWVLIRVPAPQSGGVTLCLEDVPGVVEAATVYGEADVIAKVQGKNEEEKDKVMSEVRKIPFIIETQTYRVITPIEHNMFERHPDFEWGKELYIT